MGRVKIENNQQIQLNAIESRLMWCNGVGQGIALFLSSYPSVSWLFDNVIIMSKVNWATSNKPGYGKL